VPTGEFQFEFIEITLIYFISYNSLRKCLSFRPTERDAQLVEGYQEAYGNQCLRKHSTQQPSYVVAGSAKNEKLYVCEICGFSSNDKYFRWHHKIVHMHTKQFACEYCGETFSRNYDLRRHQFRRHRVGHKGEFGMKADLPNCRFCAKEFLFQYELARHIPAHKKIQCIECGKWYAYQRALDNHRRKEHNKDDA